MKEIFKKYWIHLVFILIINIPILVLCTVRTNKYLTLKGDTTPFNSVVEIGTDYEEKGSFSTIYVVSLNHSTLFQNIIARADKTIDLGDISTFSSHISFQEDRLAGSIQYYSSIYKSLILAYDEAKKTDSAINIDYKLKSYTVTYYGPKSRFRIGDEIIAINDYGVDTKEFKYYTSENKFWIDERVTFLRNGEEKTITLTENDTLYGYHMYDINFDTIAPSVKINTTNVGGPSGGLLQTLSIYNRLTSDDITHGLKIAGTGTIDINGRVGAIGGIRQKVPTAFDDHVDIFFCVAANYDEALEAYNLIPNKEKMKLIKIETFYDALRYLREEC